MKTPIRFRNHISIVAERMVRGLVFLGALLIGNLSQNLPDLLEDAGHILENLPAFLGGLAGIFLLFLLLLGWQLLIWSKTYISISENTLVIEQNTMNRKKNTFALDSISNVNTEQNLFEMLLGTSKIKLDTNSLSTANKTDVQILLKTRDAQELRNYLNARIRQAAPDTLPASDAPANVPEDDLTLYDSRADFSDIMTHGFFSISLFSILILALSIAGAIFSVREFLIGETAGGVAGFLGSFLVIFGLFASSFYSIARGFIQYYSFRAKRNADRLYIQYGLLRKVAYTVPVDKIQALKLNQTFLARLGGRYMAEIINVGMGDDENDRNSYLILYCKKEALQEKLRLLLPEFSEALETEVQKQPAKVWAVWLIPFCITESLICFSAWCLYWFQILTFFWCAALPALFAGLGILLMLLRYLSSGCTLNENFLLCASGYLEIRTTIAAYPKIQYVELKQNPLAALLRLQKGQLHLLAGAGNQTHSLPYFSSEKTAFLKERLLHRQKYPGYTGLMKEQKGENHD
ncbi:PH domain-containing protein [uncultured Merdimonas sp.]|uniref:PH domain-containing protein n=1 Tax=uncultured Merdimonas sp. TaxID=2023269 RepID=UPI00320AB4EA